MQKKKYVVDIYRGQICDEEENNFRTYCCSLETYAISEAKAINNVRYRFAGLYSQYLPYEVGCHWSAWFWYKAKEVETGAEEKIDWQPKQQEQKEVQTELFTWRYQQ